MARSINKLNARSVDSLKTLGRHSDGGGLYLVVDRGAGAAAGHVTRRWAFMYRSRGRLREMGLGSTLDVKLSRARELAQSYRSQIADGIDPIEARRAEQSKGRSTFGAVASDLHAARAGAWKNEKFAKQWLVHIEAYCKPIWNRPVDEIGVADVVAILKPIWTTKAETASRLRGRIEAVLDAARVRGLIAEDRANPARWRGNLAYILPKRQRLQRGHHRAMPYADVPAFLVRLRGRNATAALCLEWTILTAARSAEALGARWSEIDADTKVWTIPKERMKGNREHRVPLSDRCMEILREMGQLRGAGNPHVFPGQKAGKKLSVMALEMLMRRLKEPFTVHGFRSSFRDWCGECTSYPREIAETALAHQVGNEVERSYRRGDALEKRRALMQAWADYRSEVDNVIALPVTRPGEL